MHANAWGEDYYRRWTVYWPQLTTRHPWSKHLLLLLAVLRRMMTGVSSALTFSALRMSVARLMPSRAVLYSSSQGLPW
jgi:hypothetical protein